MGAQMYGKFPLHLLKGDVDTDTATFKAMLVGSTYTFDADTHEFRSAVTGETSGSGYTAGGIALTGITVTYDATNNMVKLDAADANFGSVSLTAITGLIVYVSTGAPATDILVSYHSFASTTPTSSFVYRWNDAGILAITV